MKLVVACALIFSFAAGVWAQEGVVVEPPSIFANLVSAQQVEQQAQGEYQQLLRQASASHALGSETNPQVQRLRRIAAQLIPHANRFNSRAAQWRWEINLLRSKQINAFCMPGGKIAFYSGILDTLKLTDDEVAIVMGHEIAHALREHARERIAKSHLLNQGISLFGALVSGSKYGDLAGMAASAGGQLWSLKFSRDDEKEADVVGLDLAARAGFDPRAGVTLWQKMAAASKGAPPQWLSTHPSGSSRIEEIQRHLPDVMPLYERARRVQ